MATTALQIRRLREGSRLKGPLITVNFGTTCWLAIRLHMHNRLDKWSKYGAWLRSTDAIVGTCRTADTAGKIELDEEVWWEGSTNKFALSRRPVLKSSLAPMACQAYSKLLACC